MNDDNIPNIFDERLDNNHPFFKQRKKLQRSANDVILTGVCAGFAKYFNTEPAVVRIIAMFSLLFGAWSAAAYLIATLLMPVELNPAELSNEEKAINRKINFKTVVSGIMMTAGFYLGFSTLGIFNTSQLFILPDSFVFPVIIITAGIYIITQKNKEGFINDATTTTFLRSRKGKKLFGTCTGLANYFNTDPSTIRIIFLLGSFFTLGIFTVVYLIISINTKLDSGQVIENQ